jgi:hypothetical protein
MKMCFPQQIGCHQKRYSVNHLVLTDLDGILTHDLVRNMSVRSQGIIFREETGDESLVFVYYLTVDKPRWEPARRGMFNTRIYRTQKYLVHGSNDYLDKNQDILVENVIKGSYKGPVIESRGFSYRHNSCSIFGVLCRAQLNTRGSRVGLNWSSRWTYSQNKQIKTHLVGLSCVQINGQEVEVSVAIS